MVEAYSVETTLRLNDQLIAGLRRVSAELRTIDAQWVKLQDRMKAPLAGLQAMRTELSGIATESREIATAMRSMVLPASAAGSVERFTTALGGAERRAAGLATAMGSVAALNKTLGIVSPPTRLQRAFRAIRPQRQEPRVEPRAAGQAESGTAETLRLNEALRGSAAAARDAGAAMRSMRLPPSTVGNVERLETALGAAERRAAGLAASMGSVAASTGRAAASGRGLAPSGAGRGGHGGPPSGGLIYRGRGPAGVHGHTGISLLEMGAIAATFGMFEGTKMAAGEELSDVNALMAAGALGTDETAELRRRLREVAEATSRGTIYSRPEVAKTMPGIAGMAAVPLDKALQFMPVAIRFGEIERQMGVATTGQPFSAQESAGAAIRMAHLLGISDPAQMEKILNLMAPATFTSHTSPANLVKVLQYMMGSASGVGMSNEEAMNLGALGSILMPGTRAGTSINMLLQGMMPKAGPAGGTRMARAAASRRAELVAMGMIDPKTGELFRDASGGVLRPMMEHLHAYYEKVGPTKAYAEFVKEFSLRGARAAYEIARNPNLVTMNLDETERREQNFNQIGGVTGAQAMLNQTAWNQSLVAWANLQTIMTDLAERTLPGLTLALKGFNTAAGNVRGFLDDHPNVAAGIGYGAEIAGMLVLARMAKRLLWGSSARAATTAVAAGAGAEAAAAGGAAAGGGIGALAQRLIGSSVSRWLLGPLAAYFGDISSTASPSADQPYPTLQDWAKKSPYMARQLRLSEMANRIVAANRLDPFGGEAMGGDDLQQLRTRELRTTSGAPGSTMAPVHVESTVTGQIIVNMGELGSIIRNFVMRETDALAQGILRTGSRPSRQVSEHSF